MRSINRIKMLFGFSAIFLFTMSASVLLMPFVTSMETKQKIATALIGLLFWTSAILGYTIIAIANQERKWFIRHHLDGDYKMNCHLGFISFFSNVPATISDVILIVSLLMFIIINFTYLRYEYIAFILLFLLMLSLNFHCLFNGRVYKITKYKHIRREKKI